MKRIISIGISLLLCLGLPLIGSAEEVQICTVTADSVLSPPDKQITVPVSISGNPGFTNFAVCLEYDAERLELLSINTADGTDSYLCGALVSTNTQWKNGEKTTCGYIVSASEDLVTEDGILFTATFHVNADLKNFAMVTPLVRYIRNNASDYTVFEETSVSTVAGTVTAIVAGDVNGDGVLEYDDVMLVYRSLSDPTLLKEEQKKRADINADDVLDKTDLDEIYSIYTGGQ